MVGLNQRKLVRWLAEMLDSGHADAAARFYEWGAVLLAADARKALLDILRPLEKCVPDWGLDVEYETKLRERRSK